MNEQSLADHDQEAAEEAQGVDSIQDVMNHFIGTAHVSAVYGPPVQVGDTTIITTAEVVGGLGFGIGRGSGPVLEGGKEPKGYGGGGGGYIQSRPVAVIVASPDGVRIEPVVDVAKIALAALTAFGFIFSTLRSIQSRQLKLGR